MAAYYLDTSALVKCYVAEVGHRWIKSICVPRAKNAIFVSQVATVELEAALCRKTLEAAITVNDRDKNISLFRRHLNTRYTVMPLSDAAFAQAR